MKSIEMPGVRSCKATQCAYNREKVCHARAITIGDGTHPCCDTFFQSRAHVSGSQKAGVGACKVSICQHNDNFECQARSIELARQDCPADCATFVPC